MKRSGRKDRGFRLLVTADLHYGLSGKGLDSITRLADAVNRSRADAFAIAGDFASGGVERIKESLALFSGFRGKKLLIPGNHELWTLEGDSERIYRETLPALAQDAGFHMLDGNPVQFGDIAIVGNMGWYDYSMRDPDLKVDEAHYERKSVPGLVTLNDVRFVRWQHSDAEFTQICLKRLRGDLQKVSATARQVIVIMHFLPFAELIPPVKGFAFRFARAFMGATCFGRLLKSAKAVKYLFCGHVHWKAHAKCGHIQSCVLSGGRDENMLTQLRLPEGKVTSRAFKGE